MTHFVWLPATEAKCIASRCAAGPCARREVSADGRPVVDYSVVGPVGAPYCAPNTWAKRILPSAAVKPAEARPAKEPVRGI